MTYEVYYYSKNRECDFITKDGRKISGAIQVCHELNDENMDRETEGLLEAMADLNLKEGIILTSDQEELRKSGEMTIIIKPVWKWLLEGST